MTSAEKLAEDLAGEFVSAVDTRTLDAGLSRREAARICRDCASELEQCADALESKADAEDDE